MPLDATEVARRAARRESLAIKERRLWAWCMDDVARDHHDASGVILDAIAAAVGVPAGAPRKDVFAQVHGVAGFATEREPIVPDAELAAELRQRLRARAQLAPIVGHRLFDDFVRTRARELVGRRVGW
jgi:hypothetical protein